MRRVFWSVLAVLAVTTAILATPAAAGGGGGCHLTNATEARSSVVEMRHACFAATVTHVDPGDKVKFVNRDGITHNVVGLGNLWGDVEGMGGGDSRRFTFEESGIFPYSCTLHAGMVGAVVVGGDDFSAGDAASVSAASLAKPGGPEAPAQTETRSASAAGGDWLPTTATALVVVVLLAGLVLAARRRLSV